MVEYVLTYRIPGIATVRRGPYASEADAAEALDSQIRNCAQDGDLPFPKDIEIREVEP